MTNSKFKRIAPSLKGCTAFLEASKQAGFQSISRSCVANIKKASRLVPLSQESGSKGKALLFVNGFRAAISRRKQTEVRQLFLYGVNA